MVGEHFYRASYRHTPRSLRRYISRLRYLFEPGFWEILPVDYRYDDALDRVLRELVQFTRFDVVIVEYIFWSKALKCFDASVLKIIDTHDMFTRRHMLYRMAGQAYGWYCTTAKEEAKGLNWADIVIAIQHWEKEYFARLTSKRVITVRHIAPVVHLSPDKHSTPTLLFVGSDAGTNIHGIRPFIKEIFPLVKESAPDATLLIAGQVCNAIDNHDHCVKLGVVDDLASLYAKADVVVNPIRFSTGLCIKTIEALGYGKPVVTTPAGSRGLEEGADTAFLVADEPEAFARRVVEVLQDSAKTQTLVQSAYRFVEAWNAQSVHELAAAIEPTRAGA
ncbi:MAG: glycosyl transferase family 1 [Ignavibacteria bacterium]